MNFLEGTHYGELWRLRQTDRVFLIVIALSQLVAPDELLGTLRRYLEWLVPTQSAAIVEELAKFVEHRIVRSRG